MFTNGHRTLNRKLKTRVETEERDDWAQRPASWGFDGFLGEEDEILGVLHVAGTKRKVENALSPGCVMDMCCSAGPTSS